MYVAANILTFGKGSDGDDRGIKVVTREIVIAGAGANVYSASP